MFLVVKLGKKKKRQLTRDQTPSPQNECLQGGFLLTQVTCPGGTIIRQRGWDITTATAASEGNTDGIQWGEGGGCTSK